MTTATDKRPKVTPDAFVVEFGNDFGQNVHVASLGVTLRGTFSLARLQQRRDSEGKLIGGRSVGDVMNRMPECPGIRVRFDKSTRKIIQYDPFEDDPDTLEHASRVLNEAQFISEKKDYKAWPKVERSFDEDEWKTLLREIFRKVESKDAKVIAGKMPSMEEIDAMPGLYVYDPGNSGQDHPYYEKDVNAWRRRQNQLDPVGK